MVDYGAEHACRCDHARFGRDEGDGAFPEWDESHPIDLVGHSIGGVTARVLQQLLADGALVRLAPHLCARAHGTHTPTGNLLVS